MVSKYLLRALALFLVGLMTVGFRIYGHLQYWNLNPEAISGRKLFVKYPEPSRTLKNNLPDDDPLGGAADEVTVAEAMNSILADYNGIQNSYLILADTNDADYASMGDSRTIDIANAAAGGVSSGEAAPVFDGQRIVGCNISLTESVYKNAKAYLRTVTHEIGHCLGLDHAQETVHAVMSYFADRERAYRLQIDDKMGVTHLYPKELDYGRENPTLGLSCARR